MKFLFICGREIDYTRNQVLLRAFSKIGEVETIAESGLTKSLTLRSIRIAFRTFPKLFPKSYDLIFVGFYGHLLMIPIGLFGKSPILFDAFVSNYDTLTSDRQRFSPSSIAGRLALFLDRFSCHLANKVLVDTPANAQYFSSTIGVPINKLYSLPVSCNEDIFYPKVSSLSNHPTLILSYSTYLPVHGVDTIIQAAEILKNESLQFRLIGQGPLYDFVYKYSIQKGLKNVDFTPFLSLHSLANEIANADICLGGHFGLSNKADRVIPGKIYQMLAMGKPIIAADSTANKELLRHAESAYLCPAGNPDALARAILDLHHDPHLRKQIGIGGLEIYEKYCSEAVVSEKLHQIISETIK